MKKGKKIDYQEHKDPVENEFPEISNVASANECTGLMYKAPENADELESYRQLYSMGIPTGHPEAEAIAQEKAKQRREN